MSGPLKASAGLLNSAIFRKAPIDPSRVAAFENGTATTRAAGLTRSTAPRFHGLGPFGEMARQHRSWDRAASRGRKRMMGGAGRLPHGIRHHYTEGERAALTVVACEVQRRGFCDLPVERIAAIAGVSRRTVQYALKTASSIDRRHISVEYRRRSGQRNLPSIVRIVSDEWLLWLGRGRPAVSSIGCKEVHTKKNREIDRGDTASNSLDVLEAGGSKGLGGRREAVGSSLHYGGRAHG